MAAIASPGVHQRQEGSSHISGPGVYVGSSMLQKQAIDDATAAFGNLPRENPVFKQCVCGKERLIDVVDELHKQKRIHSKKKSTKLVERFERYTLRNMRRRSEHSASVAKLNQGDTLLSQANLSSLGRRG